MPDVPTKRDDSARRKSPRAPSMPLDEAVDRAIKAYEKERRHSAPVEAMAQSLGYKGANSGTALKAVASLRYFGLLERPSEGQLAISKDLESYQFAPSEELRQEIRVRWLRNPPVFSELLDKYQGGLPSDATLRFDLIQRGFLPNSAAEVISVFRRSVEFARYFRQSGSRLEADSAAVSDEPVRQPEDDSITTGTSESPPSSEALDRIPVRLSGGRRAWLIIPEPFFSADKDRLKAQIDLILTED